MAIKMIIGLAANTCAGKETVSQCIEKFGFKTIVQSDFLRSVAASQRIEPSPNQLWELSNTLKRQYRTDAAVIMLNVQQAEAKGYEYIVVDGCRVPAEFEWIKEQYAYVYTIAIVADEHIRFSRMRKRNRPGDPATLAKLKEMERIQGHHIEAAIRTADFTIRNNHGLFFLYMQVACVLAVCFMMKFFKQAKTFLYNMI